jgi:hypothetical protein
MTKVYENVIQIKLHRGIDTDERLYRDALERQLPSLREHYFKPTKEASKGTSTQEQAMIDHMEEELAIDDEDLGVARSIREGDVVFRLLYGVFEADIIAYLFDQAWVPATTVVPFRPRLFLNRLSVLERVVDKLKDGARTPIWLEETNPFLRPGMGPKLKCFRDRHHRLLLKCSFRELRAFGEVGLTLPREAVAPRVEISIWNPYGLDDSEVSPFVAGRTSKDREPVPGLPARLQRK